MINTTKILEILKEQASFGFTGRVNVLLKNSDQFIGTIFFSEGNIVDAFFQFQKGENALYKLIFLTHENFEMYNFVPEPEILSIENFILNLRVEQVSEKFNELLEKNNTFKKFKPESDLKLSIATTALDSEFELTPEEFDLLSIITEWSKVSDIYSKSNGFEFETTQTLISLRKKKALKVFQNK